MAARYLYGMFPESVPAALLQAPSTHETRAVRLACTLLDVPILATTLEGLHDCPDLYAARLRRGQLLPVGSVEFVREAMHQAGFAEPAPLGFPDRLQPWCGRAVRLATAASAPAGCYVKPVHTKDFNAFLLDPTRTADELSEHDREQHAAFARLEPHHPVWVSDPVRFLSEWRVYVDGGQILGCACYAPDSTDDVPVPDHARVRAMIGAVGARAPYGLDVGVLDTGETVLVEVNDAWALGLYGQALDAKVYYRLLRDYWVQAVAEVGSRIGP